MQSVEKDDGSFWKGGYSNYNDRTEYVAVSVPNAQKVVEEIKK
jgi:hypothetical protein